jgi:hypothetical protein
MNNGTAIHEELKELNSSLADVSRVLPYRVPERYFSLFGQQIAALVKDDEAGEQIMRIGKAMPFSIPQGYFETLADNIVANASAETAQTKAVPYELPQDYFNTLPSRVLQAAKGQDSAKTRTIPASKFVFRHIRLAAAAVLLLCIGLGAYSTLFNTGYRSTHRLLGSVPQSEIEAYLETTDKNEGEDISARNLSFDSKDIVVYLNETGWE